MKFYLSILLCLSTCAPTAARLGETLAQCQTRYGQPLPVQEGVLQHVDAQMFITNTWFVACIFNDDKRCVFIQYMPRDQDLNLQLAKTIADKNGTHWKYNIITIPPSVTGTSREGHRLEANSEQVVIHIKNFEHRANQIMQDQHNQLTDEL